MYALEMFVLLNRFRTLAMLAELAEGQKEQNPSAEDRAASDEKEKDRRAYVERGVKRIADFERRARGEK